MDIDIEKLRNELKDKIDEIIDSYIYQDNTLLKIPNENIYMEFNINNHNYIAFTEDSNETEELEMMFAKVELIEGKEILRSIETAEEYEHVINEFNRRLALIKDDGGSENE